MPVFLFYRGDCDNLAFLEARGLSAFTAEDDQGQTWLVVDTREPAVTPELESGAVAEIIIAQARAHEAGASSQGTQVRMVLCADEGEARRLLAPQKGAAAMKLDLQPIAVPLREEAGSYRLRGSRVSLDVVIDAFKGGADPESIVRDYDTLELGDVYAVIAYYLANKEAVEAYLRRRDEEAERLYQEAASRQPSREGLRAKLLARREERHAPVGQ